ncbi:head-tail connector protein [Actinobacillus pleuropneumoniae]|uniref:head-tail connector protein n=1 Tax=Actinobacillus pleuropneumoniae TaxID=715 RepID=UPI00030685A8|nr:head-tail connector protein [Actinobacillus pleuropneumoniae]UKH28515.1 phage gp6-like head-tail connector protein [Actinobacillus pleuropneumoniae]
MNVSISLEEIKAHLRIEHDLDDSLLEMLAESALEVAQNYIGKTWGESHTEKEVKFTSGIKVGCLMFIGHLYANRETVADVQLYEVPFAISALWNPYREPSIY